MAQPKLTLDQAQNAALRRRVVNFLSDRQFDSIDDLDVEADRGSVIVSGTVATSLDKQRCLSCCQRVAGVIKLIDQIEVE